MGKNKNEKKKTSQNNYYKNKLEKQKKQKKQLIMIIIILIIITLILIVNNFNIQKKLDKNEVELMKCQKYEIELIECQEYEATLEEISPHYVFLGDSITAQFDIMKYFEGYSVVNSGIGGDTTDDILSNMYERLYRYNPSTVFLMIGTNDVNHNKSAEYIFNNINKIIEKTLKNLPKTRIILQSITPSRGDWGETDNNEKRQEINKLLKEKYKDSSVIYIDLYELLKEKDTNKIDEKYTTDGLHLNSEAYRLISKQLKKYM